MNIEKHCQRFLEKFDFVRLEWDGVEVTPYDDNNSPWSYSEFVEFTKTRKAFKILEERFLKLGIKNYSYVLKSA